MRWDFKSLKKEAIKYKTKGEFQKKNPSVYRVACRKTYYEKICSHMKPMRVYWTYRMLKHEALKYGTRRDFELGCIKAYRIAVKRKVLNRIGKHLKESLTEKYTLKEIKLEASKHLSRGEF